MCVCLDGHPAEGDMGVPSGSGEHGEAKGGGREGIMKRIVCVQIRFRLVPPG